MSGSTSEEVGCNLQNLEHRNMELGAAESQSSCGVSGTLGPWICRMIESCFSTLRIRMILKVKS